MKTKTMAARVAVSALISMAALGSALIAGAQTSTSTGTTGAIGATVGATTTTSGTGNTVTPGATTGTTQPGLPNTGEGGDATTNFAIITVAALAIAGGVTVLGRKYVS